MPNSSMKAKLLFTLFFLLFTLGAQAQLRRSQPAAWLTGYFSTAGKTLSEYGQKALQEPAPLQQAQDYHALRAKKAVEVLQANGLDLPEQSIDYNQAISQEQFIQVLSKVSSVGFQRIQTVNKGFLSKDPSLPSDRLQRGQAVYLLIHAFGIQDALPHFSKQETRFQDINPKHPAYGAIVLAERVHLINGYPDQTIRPNETLNWGEALILVEGLDTWKRALPTTAPEWVKTHQKKQDLWYQLIDGFRLMLTLTLGFLAIFYFFRSWRKSAQKAKSPFKSISFIVLLTTLALCSMWVNQILYNYEVIPRYVYAMVAFLSILVGFLLLKTSSKIEESIDDPKPQIVIDKGFVDGINLEKGELYISDLLSDRKAVALIQKETKIHNQTQGAGQKGFFSDLKQGDLIRLKGNSNFDGALIETEQITVTGHQEQTQLEQSWQFSQTEAQEVEKRFNHVLRTPSSGE